MYFTQQNQSSLLKIGNKPLTMNFTSFQYIRKYLFQFRSIWKKKTLSSADKKIQASMLLPIPRRRVQCQRPRHQYSQNQRLRRSFSQSKSKHWFTYLYLSQNQRLRRGFSQSKSKHWFRYFYLSKHHRRRRSFKQSTLVFSYFNLSQNQRLRQRLSRSKSEHWFSYFYLSYCPKINGFAGALVEVRVSIDLY